jgi:small glutamine-rich tetratricopeptide repeat-containing protein alpha
MGGMADMLRGMGGGGGGGMPDLSSILNNPQMMQAAQAMMANGGMERLMSNPSVANMVGRTAFLSGYTSIQGPQADDVLAG